MTDRPLPRDPWRRDELIFLPLGGAGEIGMNLNLYGLDGKWLMVDLGITFADETQPGIDVITPDPTFIAERAKDLLALVITHAHEDHLGAVPYLWPRLKCPVYATRFAGGLLRSKLAEAGIEDEVELHEIDFTSRLKLGPFDLEFVSLTHSIPEMLALAIHTVNGTVVHTGDWKLDPAPLVGSVSDEAGMERLGDAGVLAMVVDSTNVFEPGWSGSEADVRDSLDKLVAGRSGRVAITTFASNVARMETAIVVAEANGRHLALVGRSMHRIYAAAKQAGYLTGVAKVLKEDEAGYLPPEKILYLCTGCQGEPRGAMARIAADQHPNVALEEGDTAIFSSRIIPGNEMPIRRLHDRFRLNGVEVLSATNHFVHVSGHPNRDELARMYSLVRPHIAVPVHGEEAHLREHAAFARGLQTPEVVEIANGQVVRLAPGGPEIVAEVQSGRCAVDGRSIVSDNAPALRERRRIMFHGAATATLVVDGDGYLLAAPSLVLRGIAEAPEREGVLARDAIEAIERALDKLNARARRDDGRIADSARLALGRMLRRHSGKRPHLDVQVVRVDNELSLRRTEYDRPP